MQAPPPSIPSSDPDDSSSAKSGTAPANSLESIGELLGRLSARAKLVNPDDSLETAKEFLQQIHRETNGVEYGLELGDYWWRQAANYPGREAAETLWESLGAGPPSIGSIEEVAIGISDAAEDQQEPQPPAIGVGGVVSVHNAPPDFRRTHVANALDRYSLIDRSAELARNAVEVVYALPDIALQGQSTAIFSAPNVGKTVLTICLLTEGINAGLLDPANIYYLNVDDSGSGLAIKAGHSDEHRFNMVAEGHLGFKSSAFMNILAEVIANKQAKGMVVILDTGKHFVDLMDKRKASLFTKKIRSFTMQGGTLILLAHVNKRPGQDGKPIYAGTSDLVDDFDAAYTLTAVPASSSDTEKIVTFECIKRRGDNVQTLAFSYGTERGMSYGELLASVKRVDVTQIESAKQTEQFKSDAELIADVKECIVSGVNTKMRLADAVAKKAGISKRRAVQIIEKFTGDNPAAHRWQYAVGARGAQMFVLLERPSVVPNDPPPPRL